MLFYSVRRSIELPVFVSAMWALAMCAWVFAVNGGAKAAGLPGTRAIPAFDAPEKEVARFGVEWDFHAGVVAGVPPLGNASALAVDGKGRFLVIELKDGKARLRMIQDGGHGGAAGDSKVLEEWESADAASIFVQGDRIWISDGSHLWMQGGLEAGVLTGRSEILKIERISRAGSPHQGGASTEPSGTATERRESSSAGGAGGRGLHAPVMGPDGRLYVPVGDRGGVVKTKEGGTLTFSDSGGVMRCEPDGTRLEIFCEGLRDPRDLTFDQYGNLFAVDGAAGLGDEDRIEYLVHGGDYGWRRGWEQFPMGRDRNPWLAGRLWHKAFDGQSAWMLPPVANIHEGTTGMALYPGTGFSPRYDGTFFFGSFVQSPLRCAITMCSIAPVGASFQSRDMLPFITHCAATGVAFGPDGKMYFMARGAKQSRIFEASDPRNVVAPEIEEARRLFGAGVKTLAPIQWAALLGHRDQRFRLAAEWALADSPQGSILLTQALWQRGPDIVTRLPRLHAIWGLGILARRAEAAKPGGAIPILTPLIDLLEDPDEEVCAQAAKTLGEFRIPAAYDSLVRALRSESPRVSFCAAEALGEFGRTECVSQILLMAREGPASNPFLRHAYVRALVESHDVAALKRAAENGDPGVRLAALLAMRRMKEPEITIFLRDEEPKLVLEAARAIYDAPIEDALPALAALIEKPAGEASLMLRVLNANFRMGAPANGQALADFASHESAPASLRVEALELLALWAHPPEQDRITGLERPLAARSGEVVVTALHDLLPALLETKADEVLLAAIKAVAALEMKPDAHLLWELMRRQQASSESRGRALETLAAWGDPTLADAIALAADDPSSALRATAARVLAKSSPDAAAKMLAQMLPNGSVPDEKAALSGLKDIQSPIADEALVKCLDDDNDKIPPEARMELFDAATAHSSPKVQASLEVWLKRFSKSDLPAQFQLALFGGDAGRGRRIFYEDAAAGCVRCHRIHDEGGESGPDLTRARAQMDRSTIMECIVAPEGDASVERRAVFIKVKGGEVIAGNIESEDASEVVLRVPGGPAVSVKRAEIESREVAPSGMPGDFETRLTRDQIRDLVEYLASLKGE